MLWLSSSVRKSKKLASSRPPMTQRWRCEDLSAPVCDQQQWKGDAWVYLGARLHAHVVFHLCSVTPDPDVGIKFSFNDVKGLGSCLVKDLASTRNYTVPPVGTTLLGLSRLVFLLSSNSFSSPTDSFRCLHLLTVPPFISQDSSPPVFFFFCLRSAWLCPRPSLLLIG